jgi:hypothetical protein
MRVSVIPASLLSLVIYFISLQGSLQLIGWHYNYGPDVVGGLMFLTIVNVVTLVAMIGLVSLCALAPRIRLLTLSVVAAVLGVLQGFAMPFSFGWVG